jgi:hypothetical protein
VASREVEKGVIRSAQRWEPHRHKAKSIRDEHFFTLPNNALGRFVALLFKHCRYHSLKKATQNIVINVAALGYP